MARLQPPRWKRFCARGRQSVLFCSYLEHPSHMYQLCALRHHPRPWKKPRPLWSSDPFERSQHPTGRSLRSPIRYGRTRDRTRHGAGAICMYFGGPMGDLSLCALKAWASVMAMGTDHGARRVESDAAYQRLHNVEYLFTLVRIWMVHKPYCDMMCLVDGVSSY